MQDHTNKIDRSITKHIKLQISGDADAVNATLVFDRPEVYRASPSPQFH